MKNFFVSYNGKDKEWAEWIAWQLEDAGFTTVIQAWDFRPGGNFVIDMQRAAEEAERTIAVLSQNYLDAMYTQPEWAAAFAQDPTGLQKTLLPVRIQECDLKGMLSQIVYIDLVGKPEDEARELLLAGLQTGRAKPSAAPGFPQSDSPTAPRPQEPPPTFPIAGNWGEQFMSPAAREAILQQGPSVTNSKMGGVQIGSVGGDIKDAVIAGGNVSHVTMTHTEQQGVAEPEPTKEAFQQLLAEIRQELTALKAEQEALKTISSLALRKIENAQEYIEEAAEMAGSTDSNGEALLEYLEETSDAVGNVLEKANKKIETLGGAVRPVTEQLEPLLKKMATAATWAAKLYMLG